MCDTASEANSSAFFDSEILNEGSVLAQHVPAPLNKPATFIPPEMPVGNFMIKNIDTGEIFDLRDSYIQSVLEKGLEMPSSNVNYSLWRAASVDDFDTCKDLLESD